LSVRRIRRILADVCVLVCRFGWRMLSLAHCVVSSSPEVCFLDFFGATCDVKEVYVCEIKMQLCCGEFMPLHVEI
jgi:hypothetical protein